MKKEHICVKCKKVVREGVEIHNWCVRCCEASNNPLPPMHYTCCRVHSGALYCGPISPKDPSILAGEEGDPD